MKSLNENRVGDCDHCEAPSFKASFSTEFAHTSLLAQQVIRVGTLEGAQGFEPAIAAVYKEIGIQVEFVLLPPERSLKSVESGVIDAEMARVVGGTAGYHNVIETNEPLLELQLLAVVRKDFKAKQLAPADLKAYKLGLYRGTKLAEGLVAKLGLEATAANSTLQTYQMLNAGRFDVALVSSVTPVSMYPEFSGSLKTLERPVTTSNVVHVVNKKWAAYVPQNRRCGEGPEGRRPLGQTDSGLQIVWRVASVNPPPNCWHAGKWLLRRPR